jgi:hypothetical protein
MINFEFSLQPFQIYQLELFQSVLPRDSILSNHNFLDFLKEQFHWVNNNNSSSREVKATDFNKSVK